MLTSAVVSVAGSTKPSPETFSDELEPPQRALVEFEPHVAATKFAVVPPDSPRFAGQLVLFAMAGLAMAVAPVGSPMSARVAGILVIAAGTEVAILVVSVQPEPHDGSRVSSTRC